MGKKRIIIDYEEWEPLTPAEEENLRFLIREELRRWGVDHILVQHIARTGSTPTGPNEYQTDGDKK